MNLGMVSRIAWRNSLITSNLLNLPHLKQWHILTGMVLLPTPSRQTD